MFVGGKATVVDIKDSTVGIMDKSDYTPGEEEQISAIVVIPHIDKDNEIILFTGKHTDCFDRMLKIMEALGQERNYVNITHI